MKRPLRYFSLQFRRLQKILPVSVLTCLVLLVLVGLFLFGSGLFQDAKAQRRFRVGFVGEEEDPTLSFAIQAVSLLDPSSFSVEMISLETREQGESLLERADLDAFVFFPANFFEHARSGRIETLDFVTRPGAAITDVLKEEVTRVISQILVQSQKGVFGLGYALRDQGEKAAPLAHDLSLRYLALLLERDELFEMVVLGEGEGLSLSAYFFCSAAVFVLFLLGSAFLPFFCRRETSLYRVLSANGVGAFSQMAGEGLAYLLGLSLVTLLFSWIVSFVMTFTSPVAPFYSLAINGLLEGVVIFSALFPVVLLCGSFHFFLYELTSSPVFSALLQLFASLFLCFFSGCLYPVTFFPDILRSLSSFLPPGAARSYLASFFSGKFSVSHLGIMLFFTASFFLFSVLLRRRKILGR